VAAAVLGGGGVLVLKNRQADYQRSATEMGGKVLGNVDLSAIAGVRLKNATNTVNIVRTGDSWGVRERGDFPANFGEVSEFVRKLAELKVVQPQRVGASRLGMLELTAEQGTQVELLGADGKTIKSLLLGAKHMKSGAGAGAESPFGGGAGGWPDGRYVMVGTDLNTIAVVSEPLANANPKAEDWIAKEFVKIDQPVSVEVIHPEATNSFALSRTNELAEWTLVGAKPGEELDKTKASQFSGVLSSPSIDDVKVNPDAKALGLDQPVQAVIRTARGFTYKLRIGKQEGEDSYPVQVSVDAELPKERTAGKDEKAEDKAKLDKEFKDLIAKQADKLKAEQAFGKWTVVMKKWSIETLLKKRSELFVDKKPDPAAAAPGGAPGFNPLDAIKASIPGGN
jgi:hypothetical protein